MHQARTPARAWCICSGLVVLRAAAGVHEAGVGVEVAGRGDILLKADIVPGTPVEPRRVVAVVVGGAAIRIDEALRELAAEWYSTWWKPTAASAMFKVVVGVVKSLHSRAWPFTYMMIRLLRMYRSYLVRGETNC